MGQQPAVASTPRWLARLEDWRWKRLRVEYADIWSGVVSVLISGNYAWVRTGRVYRRTKQGWQGVLSGASTWTESFAVADRREGKLVGDLIKSGHAELGRPVTLRIDGRYGPARMVTATEALVEHTRTAPLCPSGSSLIDLTEAKP